VLKGFSSRVEVDVKGGSAVEVEMCDKGGAKGRLDATRIRVS
jgi:hypothetical protein